MTISLVVHTGKGFRICGVWQYVFLYVSSYSSGKYEC